MGCHGKQAMVHTELGTALESLTLRDQGLLDRVVSVEDDLSVDEYTCPLKSTNLQLTASRSPMTIRMIGPNFSAQRMNVRA